MVALIIAVAVVLVVLTGSLVVPIPVRWSGPAASMAVWRRPSLRQRWQERRPLRLVYLGVVAVAAIVLTVWVLPAVLTRHPQLGTAAEQHKAIADTRAGLVAMLVAIGAAGGLTFTARTYRLSREGHVTDRYSKAVEQLGSDAIAVRLGGIFALERLMRDSPADQPTIMETLAAYVRERVPVVQPPAPRTRDRRVAGHQRTASTPTRERPAEDVQAILTVLGRRRALDNDGRIDLRRTRLTGVELTGANLTNADLFEADLAGARLDKANLAGAFLNGADLTRADLDEANLSNASLYQADLTSVRLDRANLAGAWLSCANLTNARLDGANLAGARLSAADLTRAVLEGADLTSAHLYDANLTRAGLVGAILTRASFHRAKMTGVRLRAGAVSREQLAVASHVDEIIWDHGDALPVP